MSVRPAPPADAAAATAAAGLSLRLLGVPGWRRGSGPWLALASKDAVFLARLALEGEQPRSVLAGWLWPDVPLPRAHANLRQRLYRLRQQGGELVAESDTGLRLQDGVQCDVWRDGCADDADLAAALLAGVGEDGTAGADSAAWLDEARRHWSARRADLLGGLAARHEARQATAAALAATEQLLAIEPLLEHAWRRLMRLHAQRGDRAAALAAFERCELVLRNELGVKPAPETLALLHRVESGAAATGPMAGAEGPLPLPAALLQPPRLVGRSAEQRAMLAAWQAGRAFVLLGEAGMGKSRLLLDCAAQGPGRVLAVARPGDEVVAYSSLTRLLRSMARVAPAPGRLWPSAGLREELSRLLPELGPAPDSPGRQAVLLSALEQVFQAAPAAGLQAVLFDDLQHSDEASRAVLQRVGGLPGMLWGFASRPQHAPGAWLAPWLASSAGLQPVVLAALDSAALLALLASVQSAVVPAPAEPPAAVPPGPPAATTPPPALAALHVALGRHCGGNPLFVLETLKHLHLRDELAAWTHGAATPQQTLPLPPSVHAVLTQRLQGLSERAQSLARVAAVAGTEFSVAVAADVMAETPLDVAGPWAELERAQVFGGAAAGSCFAHESALDAVRSGLPQALLAPLHARVAASLQSNGAPPGSVARHLAAAGDLAAAAPMALRAASRALQQGQTAEQLALLLQAGTWFAQAGLEDDAFDARVAAIPVLMAHEGVAQATAAAAALLPQARQARQRLALRLEQANVALAAQDLATLHASIQAALQEPTPDTAQALRVQALHAVALVYAGQHAQALVAVQGVQAGLHTLPAPGLAAELQGHLAMVFNVCGRTRDCVQALQAQLQLARATGDQEQVATALASMASQHHNLGERAPALHCAQQAAALFQRLGSAGNAFANRLNLAQALLAANHYAAAQQELQAAMHYCEQEAASTALRRIVAETCASLWLRLGHPEAVLQELAHVPVPAAVPRQIQHLLLQAQAAQLQGQPAVALRCWQAVQPLLTGASNTLMILSARAQASAALPPQAALQLLQDSLHQAQAADFPAAQAHALMARARRWLALGDPDRALVDAQQLWALRDRAGHVLLDEGELCAVVCQVADACGNDAWAQQVRQASLQAFVEAAQPHVPAADRQRWRDHALRRALWGRPQTPQATQAT